MVLITRVRADVGQKRAVRVIVHHAAKNPGRPVLRLGQPLGQGEDILGQSDRLEHDLVVFAGVCVRQTLSLLWEELLN